MKKGSLDSGQRGQIPVTCCYFCEKRKTVTPQKNLACTHMIRYVPAHVVKQRRAMKQRHIYPDSLLPQSESELQAN
ncbi:MAG TPA: hypothetical protein P5201_15165, partial [Aminobacteriaceae bacterium]|nr:hypothetical protein [Aminobacteriaceae bacterium]